MLVTYKFSFIKLHFLFLGFDLGW